MYFRLLRRSAGEILLAGVMASLLSYPTTNIYGAAEDTGPAITSQPASQTVAAGTQFAIKVAATSSAPPIAYTWYKDDEVMAGTLDLIYVAEASASDSGIYYVVLTDGNGETTSAKAKLTV